MMKNKTKIIKDITKVTWKNLGVADRNQISQEYAKIVMKSSYNEDEKSILLAAISRIGWVLKELSKNGYGYNTATGGKWKDNAGKLNVKNSRSVWVYNQ